MDQEDPHAALPEGVCQKYGPKRVPMYTNHTTEKNDVSNLGRCAFDPCDR